MQHAILTLKSKKITGPDYIKNEFLKYSRPKIITTLTHNLNHIFDTAKVLNSLNKPTIINIDKVKPDKELLCNIKGISLTKNTYKLLEKVLNKRACKAVSITEAQAGTRRERSSIGQLFILKSVVKQRICEQKTTYVAVIDIEKAYDNTWRNVMFYNLWKREGN